MGDVNLEIKLNNLDERVIKIEGGGGTPINIDSELSDTSTNPVQNKVITEALGTTNVSTTDLSNSAEGNIRSLHLLGNGRKSKNLLNPTLKTTTLNGVTCTNNGGGIYTLNGTATDNIELIVSENINLISGTNYSTFISKNAYVGLTSFLQLQKSPWTIYLVSDSGTIGRFLPKENLSEIRFLIRILSNVTLNNVVVSPMITTDVSETYDDFEPYGLITSDGVVESANADNTQTSTINASEILNSTFTGVNDIKDELIVNADGSGKWIKRVKRVDLGTLDWSKHKTIAGRFDSGSTTDKKLEMNNIICGKYNTINIYDFVDKTIRGSVSNHNIVICDTDYTDVSTFKSDLSGEFAIYELATPIETDLTPSQVSALLSLKTFRDNTTITSDCDYEIGYFLKNWQSVADVNTKVDDNTKSIVSLTSDLSMLIENLKSKGVID